MGDSYRIKTELGINKSINIQLDQEFEFLEILSLKIQQTELLRTMGSVSQTLEFQFLFQLNKSTNQTLLSQVYTHTNHQLIKMKTVLGIIFYHTLNLIPNMHQQERFHQEPMY